MIRAFALLIACSASGFAWTESVEFPWANFPQHLWERELVWLKNIGISHVSLQPGKDPARLRDVIGILRRLRLEADLEGPVPEDLQPLTRAHGGPLTDPLPPGSIRLSAIAPDALNHERRAIAGLAPAAIWTDVEDTISENGYQPGAVSFAGDEKKGALTLRKAARFAGYWGNALDEMRETAGVGLQAPAGAKSSSGLYVTQLISRNGASAVSVINDSSTSWTGEIKAVENAGKSLSLPGVTVPAHAAMMLPVHIPLVSGPLCSGCTGLAPSDVLVYATAELTSIEYENGIVAMEFSAPAAGEVVLQLDRQPYGPLVAGGKPSGFDWDEHTMRVRLPIPAGTDASNHVRIGLAIEPPDHTAFFESARVLLIGEVNRLTAQFSSKEIAARSRLRVTPELAVTQTAAPQSGKTIADAGTPEPLRANYEITVPASAVHGDHAELVLEADGIQMSHVRPQILRPVTVRFADAIQTLLAPGSSYAIYPATLAVNARTGREISLSIRNNAPEIRNFNISVAAEGLDFSPAAVDIAVGASASRDVSFRVFAQHAKPGLHQGEVRVSGAAIRKEPFQIAVIPPSGEVAWTADGFYFLESAAFRAAFLPGMWLEYLAKERGEERLPAPVRPFLPGPVAAEGDSLSFGGKSLRFADLDRLVPRKESSAPTPPGQRQ